ATHWAEEEEDNSVAEDPYGKVWHSPYLASAHEYPLHLGNRSASVRLQSANHHGRCDVSCERDEKEKKE
ncbi:hypothetical protein E2562_008579, partial [Oryza meyeriana var. granulata]